MKDEFMLNRLETQVLGMLLVGDDDALNALRSQVPHLRVTSREMTGVGFLTEFSVSVDAPRVVGSPTFKFGDVSGKADNVEHGLGFVLYVDDGALSALEGYTYDDAWPEEVHGLKLTYNSGGERNLNEFRRAIQRR
jgi:hypothetical protein